jgi:hypothetical protein
MEFEITYNADVNWHYTRRGEIEITDIVPKVYNPATKCYAAVQLSEIERKALLYAYTKAGVLEELTEEIAENNDYGEFLQNQYEDQRETAYRESLYL